MKDFKNRSTRRGQRQACYTPLTDTRVCAQFPEKQFCIYPKETVRHANKGLICRKWLMQKFKKENK